MAQVSVLPKIFCWVFTVLAALAALGAFAILAVIVINPHLPPGVHFGPFTIDLDGPARPVLFFAPANGDFDFQATAFRGTITFFVGKAGGLLETMKRYGLPLMLLRALFLAALFELLRRLFRNVGRGDSFSQWHHPARADLVAGLADRELLHPGFRGKHVRPGRDQLFLAARGDHRFRNVGSSSRVALCGMFPMTSHPLRRRHVPLRSSRACTVGSVPSGPGAQDRKRIDGMSRAP